MREPSDRKPDARRWIPPGVQLFWGDEARARHGVMEKIRSIFTQWGYGEIILPVFDYLETFTSAGGADLGQKAYTFLDRDGSLMALRPDLTTQIAKVVAARFSKDVLPLRLMYAGEVFRYEQPRAGQQREFVQLGLEHIGDRFFGADLEVLLICAESLKALGVRDFTITLGHAEFFQGICERLELSDDEARKLRDSVDHKDAFALEEGLQHLNIPEAKRKFLISLPQLVGGTDVLRRSRKIVSNRRSLRALEELSLVYETLESLGLGRHCIVDLGEVRKLDYYTGILFKVYAQGLGFEIAGGGRYDDLLGRFGRRLPAVGFSISLDRLMLLLKAVAPDRPVKPDETAEIHCGASRKAVQSAFTRARELRRKGKAVRLRYPAKRK